jgi:hypothetical protein|tara:strand:+ start:377 stop:2236 length:1860 start_codon:yes stop_codon:yes gene_type:complete
MPLQKLQFRPGIVRDTTNYTNEGGWFDGDKVRFRLGLPETIGGWTRFTTTALLGVCRDLHSWTSLSGTKYVGAGTNLKLYVVAGNDPIDITPIRATTAAGDVTFAATDGSTTITVTDTGNGVFLNDFVTFSGAVSLGGVITADVLNQEYQVTSIADADNYAITSAVAANASDTGDGGTAVIGAYQINTGLDSSASGSGWGAGVWGRGTWSSPADVTVPGAQLRLWSMDNFGEDLIANVRGGGIYYWDTSSGTGTRAVDIASLSGNNQPEVANIVLVSERDRHVIAFGCDPQGDPGNQDPLIIRFSDQESFTDWEARDNNTAGELRIGTGSEIIAAVQTKQQVIVFTDRSVSALQFIGAPFTFGLTEVSTNTSIASQNAAVAFGDDVYWMGDQSFYRYDGNVRPIPCPVEEYVFSGMNISQRAKVTAADNSKFNEVWWFYPSSSSDTNDKYVIYNYVENSWYYGDLARTAWYDNAVSNLPIAASTDGYLYFHENGLDDGSTNPPSAIKSYIESSAIDIGDGDQFMFLSRLLPDLTFRNSTAASPLATFTVSARDFPGDSFGQTNSGGAVRSATAPVEQFTEQLFFRLRGRSMSLKIESDNVGTQWRLGTPRADIRPDGRR